MISLSLSTSSVPSSFSEIGRRRSAASGYSIGGVLNIEDLDDLVNDGVPSPRSIYHISYGNLKTGGAYYSMGPER